MKASKEAAAPVGVMRAHAPTHRRALTTPKRLEASTVIPVYKNNRI